MAEPGLDSCKYLLLRELREPRDNSLLLILDEASPAPTTVDLSIGQTTLNDLRPIEVAPSSQSFEIVWDTYIAYAVRNDSFVPGNEAEDISVGRLFRVYERSNFLNYLAKATWGDVSYPGPLTHIGVICLNHIIDVAAVGLPRITRLPERTVT
jgi:hypothetical protein